MSTRKSLTIGEVIALLKEEFPALQFGYFNRTKESFYPNGEQPVA